MQTMKLLNNEQTKSLPSTHGELIGTHWRRGLTVIQITDIDLGQAVCLDSAQHVVLIPLSHLKAQWQQLEQAKQ